jgi:hypothetical protein
MTPFKSITAWVSRTNTWGTNVLLILSVNNSQKYEYDKNPVLNIEIGN